jgi:hypothetical protein
VCCRLIAEISGSNPSESMFAVCCVGSGLYDHLITRPSGEPTECLSVCLSVCDLETPTTIRTIDKKKTDFVALRLQSQISSGHGG